MAPRAYWKGNLRVSLVSFGVRLYNAVTISERVTLNRIHKGCSARLKFPPTCPVHGQVEKDEIVKAYEFEKDKYVVVEQHELDRIRLRTEKTIEVERFVAAESVQGVYLDAPYYMAPDGPMAEEPFRVINEALRETGTVGIGRISLAGKERPVLLRGEGPGFVLTTLHAASEVRGSDAYFEDIPAGKVAPDQLRLAVSLINGKTAAFDPGEFRDRYQDALLELVRAKIEGEEPVIIHEEDAPTTFNFMEALKQSLAEQGRAAPKPPAGKRGARKPPAKSVEAKGKKKRKRA